MIHRRERASHPVGTTIRLVELFNLLPVRKQTALKAATKSLTRIKRVMQAYALARPAVRFSLRILKAKNEKSNWLYAPKADASVEDAAIKVVGKDCATQCVWHASNHEGYEIEALLPRGDANVSAINNIGQFISVDSRPMSAARGFLKKIGTLFKDRLRSTLNGDTKDPFLAMNIVCPPQSYDANVEPAKDDVMFEDNDIVLSAVEKLLGTCYPALDLPGNLNPPVLTETPLAETERPAKRLCVDHNMWNGDDDDDAGIIPAPHRMLSEPKDGQSSGEEEADSRDATVFNPWTLAKMTASIRPQLQRPEQDIPGSRASTTPNHNKSPHPVVPPVTGSFPPYSPWSLPTPVNSSSPLPRDTRHVETTTRSPPKSSLELGRALPTPDPDDAIFRPASEHSRRPSPLRTTLGLDNVDHVAARTTGFVSALEIPLGTPWLEQTPPRQAGRHQSIGRHGTRAATKATANAALLRPFIPPVVNTNRKTQREESSSEHPRGRNGDIRTAFNASVSSPTPQSPPLPRPKRRRQVRVDPHGDSDGPEELSNRLEDELGIPRQSRIRSFKPPQQLPFEPDVDSPPGPGERNLRPRSSIPASPQTSIASPAAVSHDGPSRNKRTRSSTAHLPLESVPSGHQLHDLMLTISTSIAELATIAQGLQLGLEQALPLLPHAEWEVLSDDDDEAENAADDDEAEDGATPRAQATASQATGKRSMFTNPPPTAAECSSWREALLEFLQTQGFAEEDADNVINADIEGALVRVRAGSEFGALRSGF